MFPPNLGLIARLPSSSLLRVHEESATSMPAAHEESRGLMPTRIYPPLTSFSSSAIPGTSHRAPSLFLSSDLPLQASHSPCSCLCVFKGRVQGSGRGHPRSPHPLRQPDENGVLRSDWVAYRKQWVRSTHTSQPAMHLANLRRVSISTD